MPQDYWIAIRNDGKNGNGTINDPFDGSSGKLDAIFLAFAKDKNLTFNLAAGTYGTVGIANGNFEQLKEGWQIKGAGVGRTIVKLIDFYKDTHPQGGFNICFTTWYKNVNNVTVQDLTIDCNYWELYFLRPRLGLSAIRLYGNRNKIKKQRGDF